MGTWNGYSSLISVHLRRGNGPSELIITPSFVPTLQFSSLLPSSPIPFRPLLYEKLLNRAVFILAADVCCYTLHVRSRVWGLLCERFFDEFVILNLVQCRSMFNIPRNCSNLGFTENTDMATLPIFQTLSFTFSSSFGYYHSCFFFFFFSVVVLPIWMTTCYDIQVPRVFDHSLCDSLCSLGLKWNRVPTLFSTFPQMLQPSERVDDYLVKGPFLLTIPPLL